MSRWATWANLLTSLRLTLIPATLLAILYADWFIAAVTVTTAIISDIYDGKLARKFDQASPLGGLLDHATDALFVSLGCWALSAVGSINPWLCYFIAAAFVQYMLDSKALAGRALRTSQLGRLNGIAYFAILGTGIGIPTLSQLMPVMAGLLSGLSLLLSAAAWLLVLTTIASMTDRMLTFLRRDQ